MKQFKIYNFTKNSEPKDFSAAPYDLNYNVLGLHKERTWNKGQINDISYWGKYDMNTQSYSDLIVKEYRTFFRVNEMLHRRMLKIEWYLDDDSIGATKDDQWKYYSNAESLKAGEIRRRNVISNLKITSIGIIMMAYQITQLPAEQEGWKFLTEFSSEITQFIEGAQQPLKDAILATANHAWLDAPLDPSTGYLARNMLHDEINIDYTENNIYV